MWLEASGALTGALVAAMAAATITVDPAVRIEGCQPSDEARAQIARRTPWVTTDTMSGDMARRFASLLAGYERRPMPVNIDTILFVFWPTRPGVVYSLWFRGGCGVWGYQIGRRTYERARRLADPRRGA